MALPTYYPFKTRVYNATSITSGAVASVAVVARAKLVGVRGAYNINQTASAGAFDVTVNGSTATGMGAVAVTTGVAGVASFSAVPTAVTYLNAGDVLATTPSSMVSTTYSFIVQEF